MTEPTAADLLRSLRDLGRTLATAESLTGGLLAARFTVVAGASAAYRGGVVAYAGDVKREVLGVPEEILTGRGAVSAETAMAMAVGVRRRLAASYGVATTGVAGPDDQDGHPLGTAFVAVADEHATQVRGLRLAGDRGRVQQEVCLAALRLLAEVVARSAAAE